MYLHLGQDTMVRIQDIVAIFDLDTASLSKKTRDYLANAEKQGRVVYTSYELPKSFSVMKDGRVFVSQLSSHTLKGRLDTLPGR